MTGFAVNLTGSGASITGVIQLDQTKPVDLAARGARPKGEKLPAHIVDDALDRLATIFGFERPE